MATDEYDVYVGRPSKFGNNFIIGTHGNREECIKLYAEWIQTQPELIEAIKTELKGKRLGCWCFPKYRCHAEILAWIADEDIW